ASTAASAWASRSCVTWSTHKAARFVPRATAWVRGPLFLLFCPSHAVHNRPMSHDSRFTRRQAFVAFGSSLAASAIFRDRAFADAPGPVMRGLSEFMASATTRKLPDEVIEHTKQHVLDTFAAMIP